MKSIVSLSLFNYIVKGGCEERNVRMKRNILSTIQRLPKVFSFSVVRRTRRNMPGREVFWRLPHGQVKYKFGEDHRMLTAWRYWFQLRVRERNVPTFHNLVLHEKGIKGGRGWKCLNFWDFHRVSFQRVGAKKMLMFSFQNSKEPDCQKRFWKHSTCSLCLIYLLAFGDGISNAEKAFHKFHHQPTSLHYPQV